MENFDESLGYLLNIVAGINKNVLYSILAPYDITPEQFVVLNKLSRVGSKTQKELAGLTYKDEPNIARIVKKLEVKGYIERTSDSKDKRNNLILITMEGQTLLNRLEPLIIEYRKGMFQSLSAEEVIVAKRLLIKIVESNG